MSKRLITVMTEYIRQEGPQGKLKLALAIGRGERMVDRYWKRESIPSRDTALKLALACGINEPEAREIASEYSLGQRRTA